MMSPLLHLDSWAGRTRTPVTIVKATPKRYRVRLEADCMKGKRGTVLNVPKAAVTFPEDDVRPWIRK